MSPEGPASGAVPARALPPAPALPGADKPLLTWWQVSLGDAALALFALCAVSGALLTPVYDAKQAVGSIAEWLLANPGAVFMRNLHYWTAQGFLVLTLLHAWDHLRRWRELRLRSGVWTRLVASLPVLGFLMLSGFLLRGDADALQARRILDEVLHLLPLVGAPLSALLLGSDEADLQIVFVQHAATATIVVWLVTIEHARRAWGGLRAGVLALVVAGAVSLLVSPGLHDGRDPVLKGPWYFLGLQELLHWTAWPVLVVAGLALPWWLAWRLPRLGARHAAWGKRALYASVVFYVLLCFAALLGRGENWSLHTQGPVWPAGPGDLRAGPALQQAGTNLATAALPTVLGRPEGCLACHGGMTGFSPAHDPQATGCSACHGGDVFTLDAQRAHAGMRLVPGNLADAAQSCGSAGCHAEIVPRVQQSIMATFSGVITTNRRVFGEQPWPAALAASGAASAGTHAGAHANPHAGVHGGPGPFPTPRDLGQSPADSHLRQLCVGCHLGQIKSVWGPITQEAVGGGCNACHLVYDEPARRDLAAYMPEVPDRDDGGPPLPPPPSGKPFPKVHPRLSVHAGGSHCFGCHSRSSRISTSYEGWHELRTDPTRAERAAQPGQFRELEDGRFFTRRQADVHHTAGLDCIDCHTSTEVMGGGKPVANKAAALRVRCEDCHAAPGQRLATLAPEAVDPESRRILALRGWLPPGTAAAATTAAGAAAAAAAPDRPGTRMGATRSGDALLNVYVDDSGRGWLRHKQAQRGAAGKVSPLKPQAAACAQDAAHQRLSCNACHTTWAPQCTSCHTQFDPGSEAHDHLDWKWVQGEWMETAVEFGAGPPALGVRPGGHHGEKAGEIVDTFVPGMIMTLDRNMKPGAPPDVVFRRLFAPTAAHTIGKARSCTSCHNDAVALGLGAGTLKFTPAPQVTGGAKARAGGGGRSGRWAFQPAQPASPHDGLPEDAWTGWLAVRQGEVSTQPGARPFSPDEQRRILTVGACLTCHEGNSRTMQAALRDFAGALARRSRQCATPAW